MTDRALRACAMAHAGGGIPLEPVGRTLAEPGCGVDAAAATAPAKRPRPEPVEGATAIVNPAAEENAKAEARLVTAQIEAAWKNKVACLGHLVRLAQRIERVWDSGADALRPALLRVFRDALLSLDDHPNKECAELASYGQKMKSLDMDLKHFLVMALPIERQHTRGLRDDEFLVTRPDDLGAAVPVAAAATDGQTASGGVDVGPADADRMPLVLVLDNLRSAFNVGAIFRTAECLRVKRIYLCGYTATPEDNRGQTAKAAMGADAYVPWETRQSTVPLLEELRGQGMQVVGLETVKDAVSLHSHAFPQHLGVALVLGNERHGLEADRLAACSTIVRIPCNGVKNSLNVGVATAICSYEIARQWSLAELGGDPAAAGGGGPAGGAK